MGDVPTVVVTGAAGYVGSRLVAHLTGLGHDVRPVVRSRVPWVAHGEETDLRTAAPGRLVDLCAGADTVVHLAGASEVHAAAEPDEALADTVAVAQRVFAAAAGAGVRRLVHLSTVHVYGPSVGGAAPGSETEIAEDTPIEPRHPYAIARATGEMLARASGVPDVFVLRLTNAVGAPVDREVDRWTLVANELSALAARGEPLVLRSPGHQWRDFVPLRSVCEAIGAVVSPASEVRPGTYNLGSGGPMTVRQLAERIAALAERVTGAPGVVVAPDDDGPRPGRVTIDCRRLLDQLPRLTGDLDDELVATMRVVHDAA